MPRPLRYDQLSRNDQSTASLSFGELRDSHIIIRDARVLGGTQSINVARWMRWPNLARPFIDGFLSWAPGKTPRSRGAVVVSLTAGWFAYLSSINADPSFALSDITTTVVNDFLRWLDTTEVDGTAKWHVSTRHDHYLVVRKILRELRRHRTWRSALCPDLTIRPAPWSGVNRPSRPTEPIPQTAFEKLLRACAAEVTEVHNQYHEDWRSISAAEQKLPEETKSPEDYKDLPTALAALNRLFPSVIPERPKIIAANRHLDEAINKYHGYLRVATPLQPRQRLLVPFVLLLGFYYQGNTSLILNAERSDFTEENVLGDRRLVWRPFKARAQSPKQRSFSYAEDLYHPTQLLRFIEKWTSRIRLSARPEYRDRVFLFVPEGGEAKRCTGFSAQPALVWRHNLRRFFKSHKLPYITLRNLRFTGLDNIANLFPGDLRAPLAAGGHTQTTRDRHYAPVRSGPQQRQGEEAIASVTELRSRAIETFGRIDPRKETLGGDRGAATPGWRCLDPFDSPIPGQSKGKLCCAYGVCPVCPLAHLDINSPYALARLHQLRERIIEVQREVPPQRWLGVWVPVLSAIEQRWLPLVRGDKIRRAAANIALSPLPRME